MAACAESKFIQQTIKNYHSVKTNRAKQKVSTGLKLAIFEKLM
jgi:hypothetical protein